ncbi:MAG: extracellular solute-binding protein [Siculibacillus sp.]
MTSTSHLHRLLAGAAVWAGLAGGSAQAGSLDGLIAAAKAEGTLTVMALPRDWCGYGALIDRFKAKYGLTVVELAPEAGSEDELAAIRAAKAGSSAPAPDVIDVGLAYGPPAKAEGLTAPYKVATWDDVPASQKDPDGHWTGDYFGVLAFEINKDLVREIPRDWNDLAAPHLRGQVALAGDPRTANQAVMAVYAAGLARSGSDASKAARTGLDFFAGLARAGNLVRAIGTGVTVAQGLAPVTIRWDYMALSDRDKLAGDPPVEVVVPRTGVVAGVYVQAISAHARHPAAARLWLEYLYSDEGQIGWLEGYCHPVRFGQLAAERKIPTEVMARLPAAEAYGAAVFPTLEEQNAAKAEITRRWDEVVGIDIGR